jgi:hypothetical protein
VGAREKSGSTRAAKSGSVRVNQNARMAIRKRFKFPASPVKEVPSGHDPRGRRVPFITGGLESTPIRKSATIDVIGFSVTTGISVANDGFVPWARAAGGSTTQVVMRNLPRAAPAAVYSFRHRFRLSQSQFIFGKDSRPLFLALFRNP